MRLSIQLYTLRNNLEADVQGTLESIKSFGLDYVELAGFYGKSAEDWKQILDKVGLKVSGSHTPVDRVNNELDKVIAEAELLGFTSVIIPWLDKTKIGSWKKVAEEFTPIAQRLKDAGLQMAYHNHDFEFEPEDGKPGLDVFYESSSPDLIKAQLDLAWVLQGGQDPAAYIAKYADRIASVHLKDTKLSDKHTDTIAGTGDVDWTSTLAACASANVAVGSIEMDNPPGDPLQSVKGCIDFFKGKGLS